MPTLPWSGTRTAGRRRRKEEHGRGLCYLVVLQLLCATIRYTRGLDKWNFDSHLPEKTCQSDKDCRESKKCEKTKWYGKVCKIPPTLCKSDSDCDRCNECVKKVIFGHKEVRQCAPKLLECSDDKDCKSGKRCVTPLQGNSKKRICTHAPLPCDDDKDCAKGRVCERDLRFKEVRKACRDRSIGGKCRHSRDCPSDSKCRDRRCRKRRLKMCRVSDDCDDGEECVYGPGGLSRVCVKSECNKDKDCREEDRECAETRWSGRKCVHRKSSCKKHSDCEECERCVKSHHMKRATCRKRGEGCKKDKDCKEGKRCLVAREARHGEKRCHKVPFVCKSDEECDDGKFCVRNPNFAGVVRKCDERPKRCSDHGECNEGQECIETLVGGFNGPEWSARCLTDDKCSDAGYQCIQHKAYGKVCVCNLNFGKTCHTDGDCPGELVCDAQTHRCLDPAYCSHDSDCAGGEECVPLQYFKWRSLRCLPLPTRCHTDEECLEGVQQCREYYRNGRKDLHNLANHKFYRYGKRCLRPEIGVSDLARSPIFHDPRAKCDGSRSDSDNSNSKSDDEDEDEDSKLKDSVGDASATSDKSDGGDNSEEEEDNYFSLEIQFGAGEPEEASELIDSTSTEITEDEKKEEEEEEKKEKEETEFEGGLGVDNSVQDDNKKELKETKEKKNKSLMSKEDKSGEADSVQNSLKKDNVKEEQDGSIEDEIKSNNENDKKRDELKSKEEKDLSVFTEITKERKDKNKKTISNETETVDTDEESPPSKVTEDVSQPSLGTTTASSGNSKTAGEKDEDDEVEDAGNSGGDYNAIHNKLRGSSYKRRRRRKRPTTMIGENSLQDDEIKSGEYFVREYDFHARQKHL